MKGRKAPPRPEVAAVVRKAKSLTMEDIERALEAGIASKYNRLTPIIAERMPEPTPYERGFLDRFQDRGYRK